LPPTLISHGYLLAIATLAVGPIAAGGASPPWRRAVAPSRLKPEVVQSEIMPLENPMKHTVTSAFTVIAFVLVCSAQAGNDDHVADRPTVEAIRLLEEERNQAILHGDAATLDRMTSNDYTFVTLRGEMLTKAAIVQNFRSGAAKYQSREISDLNIRVYGDSAVVTGRAIQKGAENGKDYSGDYWFTRVYVNQRGRWITVALQTTLIQK
jgi:hypothetical protein